MEDCFGEVRKPSGRGGHKDSVGGGVNIFNFTPPP